MSVVTPVLTKRATTVTLLAGEWAQTRGAAQIGAEHLLLALLDEEHGVAAVVLRACGVELAKLLQILPPPPQRSTAPPMQKAAPPPSPSFARARKLAADEARALGHPYVETGHLLLGLLASGDATAIGLLESCGATADQARAETLEMLSAPDAPLSERSRIEEVEEDVEIERLRRRDSSSRFTESATQVLVMAAEEARGLGSATVEAIHLLLALAAVEGTIASAVLLHLGVDSERLRSAIAHGAARVDTGDAPTKLGLSAKAAIERSVAEARRLGHRQIAPGHLLLALTTAPEADASGALRALGVPALGVPARRFRALTLQMTRRVSGSRRLRRFWVWYRVVRVIFILITLALMLSLAIAVALAVGFVLAKLGFSDPIPSSAALLTPVLLIVVARFALALRMWRRQAIQRF